MTTETPIAMGAARGPAARGAGHQPRDGATAADPPAGPRRTPVGTWVWPAALFVGVAGAGAVVSLTEAGAAQRRAEDAVRAVGGDVRGVVVSSPPVVGPGASVSTVGAAALAAGLFGLLRARERDRQRAAEQAEVLRALTQIAAALATEADPLSPSRRRGRPADAEGGPHVPAAGASALVAAAVRDGFGHQLVELAEASRRLLRMDRAGVLLLDESAGSLELLADAGDMPPDRPQTYLLADLPACRRALEGGEPVFVESVPEQEDGPTAAADPPAAGPLAAGSTAAESSAAGSPVATSPAVAGAVNRRVLAAFRAGSVVLIPLGVRGERVGLLTVSSTAGRRFAESDRRLVAALGSHATLILAQARLSAGTAAALAAQRRLAGQRDALWAVTAAAFEAATLRQSLDRIVELAPSALGVRRCTIAEATGRPDEMVVVATTGGWGADRSAAPFSVGGRPGGRALATGRPVVVQYARDDLGAVPWPGGSPPPPGGRVYLPLLRSGDDGTADAGRDAVTGVAAELAAGGWAASMSASAGPEVNDDARGSAVRPDEAGDAGPRPRAYGVMGLTRDQPGPFDPEQLAMAEVFAARAAAAIERARLRERTEGLLRQTNGLLEQSRRDAADRAVLLRELNHRVKNNLAGIVGLLSARPPGLDRGSPAWVWLDRVADRVRTMAETHELFVGGAAAVRLADLVNRVVGSLPTPEGAAVVVRTDVGDAGAVTFETGRAVGLAMVLHELCFNAVVHGLGGGGTLAVTARLTTWPATGSAAGEPAAAVVLDVADDGPPDGPTAGTRWAAGTQWTAGTGLGLTLVRELVGRELRGTFALEPRPPRGTTARVTFPLPAPPAGPNDPPAAAAR
jgi:two-component sensor histidine kinase